VRDIVYYLFIYLPMVLIGVFSLSKRFEPNTSLSNYT